MALIHLTVVTPEGKFFEDDAQKVIVRTTGGDVCILPNHIDYAASIGEGEATCRMELTARHQNANGGIMGGAIFTLADFAFAAAVNNVHRPTVAQQVSINYLNAPKGKILTAHAHCLKDGRHTCVYIVDVLDDTGRDVARFTGTGYKLSITV